VVDNKLILDVIVCLLLWPIDLYLTIISIKMNDVG